MKFKRSMNVVIACMFIVLFAIISITVPNKVHENCAYADITSVNNYVEAKAFLGQVKAEYDACIANANGLYAQIEQTTSLAFEAQRKMAESRLYLGDLAKYEYTNSTQFSIIMTVISSENLDDLFKNMDYANSVMDYQYRLVQEQIKAQNEFKTILDELNVQNSKQNGYLAEAANKLNVAAEVLNAAKSKLTPEELAELEGEISDIGGGGDPDPGGGGGGDDPDPGG